MRYIANFCVTLILAFVFVASSLDISARARVIKTENGNCQSGPYFRTRHHVDLDGDNKADFIVTVWCDGTVSTTPAKLIGGSWPGDINNWYNNYSAIGLSGSGSLYVTATIRDVSTNISIGTVSKDSAGMWEEYVFYTLTLNGGDPAPYLNLESPPYLDLKKADALAIEFDAYTKGLHLVRVHFLDSVGEEHQVHYQVVADGFQRVILRPNLPEGATIIFVSILRPDKSSLGTSFPKN